MIGRNREFLGKCALSLATSIVRGLPLEVISIIQ